MTPLVSIEVPVLFRPPYLRDPEIAELLNVSGEEMLSPDNCSSETATLDVASITSYYPMCEQTTWVVVCGQSYRVDMPYREFSAIYHRAASFYNGMLNTGPPRLQIFRRIAAAWRALTGSDQPRRPNPRTHHALQAIKQGKPKK
jgi:hypothetical protein